MPSSLPLISKAFTLKCAIISISIGKNISSVSLLAVKCGYTCEPSTLFLLSIMMLCAYIIFAFKSPFVKSLTGFKNSLKTKIKNK